MDIRKALFRARLHGRRNASVYFGAGLGAAYAGLDRRKTIPSRLSPTGERPNTLAERIGKGTAMGLYAGFTHRGMAAMTHGMRRANRYMARKIQEAPEMKEEVRRIRSMMSQTDPILAMHPILHPLEVLRAKRFAKLRGKRYLQEFKDFGIEM